MNSLMNDLAKTKQSEYYAKARNENIKVNSLPGAQKQSDPHFMAAFFNFFSFLKINNVSNRRVL